MGRMVMGEHHANTSLMSALYIMPLMRYYRNSNVQLEMSFSFVETSIQCVGGDLIHNVFVIIYQEIKARITSGPVHVDRGRTMLIC